MNYTKQKNTIYRNLGEDLVNLLKTTNAILAGGAITSIFSGNEINDYDIYFRSKEDLIVFVRNLYCDEDNLEEDQFVDIGAYSFVCTSQTERSITFGEPNNDKRKIQLIHFDYFDNATEIFDSYDFSINMGAYDFKHEEFVFSTDFLTDIAQRRLTFNAGTKYPIMSTLRVSKYVDRGYVISKKEMFKIGLAVADLNITSWEELEDQLSGFYGVDVSAMFDRRQEFSIEAAIEMLDLVEELPTNFDNSPPNLRQVLFNIEGNPYKNQVVFYKPVNRINRDDSTGQSWTSPQIWTLGVEQDVKHVDVYATEAEAIAYVNNHWRNGEVGVMVLMIERGSVTMGHYELEVSGIVRPFAFTIVN
ncbi:hypothetical protein DQT32_04600 [Salmonella enterica subsp. enterica serovar Braenderup]|nr:hypothetical protein [Salmonella enterica subsp. enterica serovar Braenderup]